MIVFLVYCFFVVSKSMHVIIMINSKPPKYRVHLCGWLPALPDYLHLFVIDRWKICNFWKILHFNP